jgi:hypothetical protein
MKPSTSLRAAVVLTLLALALVALPVIAEPGRQCQGPAASNAPSLQLALATDLAPMQMSAAPAVPDFTLKYIGQCCKNNDASLCPAVPGYSSVYCALPMCGSGLLSCVYQ